MLGRDFLRDLYGRGLEGKRCELITTDGGNGLRNALEVVYPRIPRQHCWAHKTRNVLDKVKKVDQEKVKKDLHWISHAKNRQAATQAYWSFCQKYRKAYPGAVKSLESEIEDLLSFYQVKLSAKRGGTWMPRRLRKPRWRCGARSAPPIL